MLPKLIITDIDGVWTDGGMYYDQTGNEFKKFNTYDSAGVIFCKRLNIPIAIITGETTEIVKKRASKLEIEYVFMGVQNKLDVALDLCKKLNLEIKNIAFIGDDLNDIELLKMAGISAVPNSSPEYIKRYAKHVMTKNGGEGVFREFIEHLISQSDQKLLVKLLKDIGYDSN